MAFMKYLNLIFLLALTSQLFAQKYTISGYIKEAGSGESLIGANVYNARTLQGTTTNNFGFYSLTLNRDSIRFAVSYVGYQTQIFNFFLHKDTTIHVNLSAAQLREVVIRGTAEGSIQESSRMGTIQIPIDQIKAMPALLGEVDVLKVLQLLPGVQSGVEGSSGLYVRGGGPDQNLILLDGVPVYNASHLFGFFSVFNADAINHVELIKGGFPARYGGRLSSVIDIHMKEGNMNKIQGEGSIGIVASKLTLEGPIKKDQTSFIVSARRTYIDLLTRPLIKLATQGNETAGYYFYDLNAKINHRINDKNRIYLSSYLGDDKAYGRYSNFYIYDNQRTDYKENFGLTWGNLTTALRWNSIINKKLFSNLTATYSRYRFDIFSEYEETISGTVTSETNFYAAKYLSGIRDYALKIDFDYLPSPKHYVRFGAQAISHQFTPGAFNFKSTEARDTTFGASKILAKEFFVYAEDDFLITDRLKINFGLHASGFYVQNRFYHSVQPRVSGRYLLNPMLSLKGSYAKMAQFIHLLTNAGLGLPTDLWVPATPLIGPELSHIFSAGFGFSPSRNYELSIEGYYKEMNGLIEYKDGANFLNLEDNWQNKVEVGRGESYGAELFLQKKTGKVNGWVGYTLSWTNRQFDNLNNGEWFPFKYDRRHDVGVALAYQWKEDRDFSFTWVYGTGSAISLPVSAYQSGSPETGPFGFFFGGPIYHFEGRNGFRMRPYHRLDIGFGQKKKTGWGEQRWSMGVYNLYNRRNPFFMDIGTDRSGKRKFIQYSLFPIIPSLSYSFKF